MSIPSQPRLQPIVVKLKAAIKTAGRKETDELARAMNEFVFNDQITAGRLFRDNDEFTTLWDAVQDAIHEKREEGN